MSNTIISKEYSKSLSKSETLSKEEEIKLAIKINSGDKIARNLLITSNIKLVACIAKKYKYKADINDIISEGNIGLIKAVDKYDYTKGFRFSTYATWWITDAIKNMLFKANEIIYIPLNKIKESRLVEKSKEKLTQKILRKPNNIEIANSMGISVEDLGRFNLNKFEPIEIKPDSYIDYETPLSILIDKQSKDRLISLLMNVLNNIEFEVIIKRFNLTNSSSKNTIESISNETGLTKSNIKKIQINAINKIKQHLNFRSIDRNSIFI